MNLVAKEGKISCRFNQCNKTLDVPKDATVKEIKNLLKSKDWSATYPTSSCPEHYYSNQKVKA